VSSTTYEQGQHLAEQHKAQLLDAVKAGILTVAEEKGEVHANDLGFVSLPDEHKNLRGIAFRVLLQSGRIEPTGERRKATAPESHGRRSDVYRLQGAPDSPPCAPGEAVLNTPQQTTEHGRGGLRTTSPDSLPEVHVGQRSDSSPATRSSSVDLRQRGAASHSPKSVNEEALLNRPPEPLSLFEVPEPSTHMREAA